MKLLTYVAILGDILFAFWIIYNAIDEGFSGSIVQVVSSISLVVVLSLNIAILYSKRNSS